MAFLSWTFLRIEKNFQAPSNIQYSRPPLAMTIEHHPNFEIEILSALNTARLCLLLGTLVSELYTTLYHTKVFIVYIEHYCRAPFLLSERDV